MWLPRHTDEATSTSGRTELPGGGFTGTSREIIGGEETRRQAELYRNALARDVEAAFHELRGAVAARPPQLDPAPDRILQRRGREGAHAKRRPTRGEPKASGPR